MVHYRPGAWGEQMDERTNERKQQTDRPKTWYLADTVGWQKHKK